VNAYIRPLLRFWWVLALGLCTAAVAGILVVDNVSLGIPPKLKSRATPEFQADAQLIVDSAQGALFRTNTRVVTPQPDRIQYVCTKNATTGKQTCVNKHIPVAPTVQD